MDSTISTLAKLAQESGTSLQDLQKGLGTLTENELVDLQRAVLARLSVKLKGR